MKRRIKLFQHTSGTRYICLYRGSLNFMIVISKWHGDWRYVAFPQFLVIFFLFQPTKKVIRQKSVVWSK